jgi:hypothetical protein
MANADVKKVLQMIKEKDIKYVDLRFTDPRGKWQHLAHAVETINEDVFEEGLMFDGSSIAGWKAINESDMVLIPDAKSAVIDPFAAQSSLILFCDVYEPGTGQPYNRDPRSIAKKAEAYLASSGVGDTAYFGPEIEFFVFDDVRYKVSMNTVMHTIDSEEGPYVTDKSFPDGNMGHRPPIKGGYFPVPPVDSASDLRAEMLTVMKDMGLQIEKHHHEVAPSQHELGNVYSTLVKAADGVQIYKYVVHNVAHQYGKTATFICRPVRDGALLHRRHHQACQGDQRLHQSAHQLLQAADPWLRSAGAARLFGAQPFGLVPHPLRRLAQGQARRGALPRSGRQPLSRLRGDDDGRPGRHQEQDPSRRPDGQEPLRPAPGRTQAGAAGLRIAARGAGESREGPQVPARGRRLHPRHDQRLHGAEVGRGLQFRAHAASGRVRDVLLGLTRQPARRQARAARRRAALAVFGDHGSCDRARWKV